MITVAHEHGVPTDAVDSAAREVVENSIVSDEDFAQARFVSRVRHMFTRVDQDGSGFISARELRKAIRRYQIPIKKGDFDVVWRVLDPSGSGGVNMMDFVGFMTATDADLIQRTLAAARQAMKTNAEKGGEGLLDIMVYTGELGETLVEGVPGGDMALGMLKDPFGETKEIGRKSHPLHSTQCSPHAT